jgi:hypothetical protein
MGVGAREVGEAVRESGPEFADPLGRIDNTGSTDPTMRSWRKGVGNSAGSFWL